MCGSATTLWIKITKSTCYWANILWYIHTALFKLRDINSCVFCYRFQHAVSWCPRTYNTMRRGVHQAFGQPSVQRHLCRQGKGGLCPGREVGWRAHSWESLPCHCSINTLSGGLCICSSDVELYWVQSCCKMQFLDTHGSHFSSQT